MGLKWSVPDRPSVHKINGRVACAHGPCQARPTTSSGLSPFHIWFSQPPSAYGIIRICFLPFSCYEETGPALSSRLIVHNIRDTNDRTGSKPIKRHDLFLISCPKVGGRDEKISGNFIAGRRGVGIVQFPFHSF